MSVVAFQDPPEGDDDEDAPTLRLNGADVEQLTEVTEETGAGAGANTGTGTAGMSRRGWVVFLVAVTVALTAAAVAHVWVRLRVIHLGYQISRASVEEQQLVEQNKRLKIEAAVLRQPGRIEQIARERLGMQRPDPGHIHVIRVTPEDP